MAKKRYDEGGVTEEDLSAANASEDPIQTLNKRKGWTDTGEEAAPKKQTFKEAFAAARKAGDKTFQWEGKKFTTELASEKKAAPKAEAKTESKKSDYETPYDRMNRENREQGKDFDSLIGKAKKYLSEHNERNKALPLKSTKSEAGNKFMGAGMKKGGGVKGWGAARGARKAKTY